MIQSSFSPACFLQTASALQVHVNCGCVHPGLTPCCTNKITGISSFPPKMTRDLVSDSGAQPAQSSSFRPQVSLPSEQQLGVVLALQIFVYEVSQELFEDISSIFQLALQYRHDQRGHITTVPHGEAALGLQCSDEGQQENLVIDELGKELQSFLHPFLPIARDLHKNKGSLYQKILCGAGR